MTRDEIIDFIMSPIIEGGDKVTVDQGGLTKYGIALKWHPGLTEDQLRNLTPQSAAAIYQTEYWAPIQGDALPPAVALMLMDAAVQHDPHTAVVLLQRSVRVTADGHMGGQTLRAVMSEPADSIVQELAARRGAYYSALNQPQDILGWMRRLFRVYTRAASLDQGLKHA